MSKQHYDYAKTIIKTSFYLMPFSSIFSSKLSKLTDEAVGNLAQHNNPNGFYEPLSEGLIGDTEFENTEFH